MDDTISQIGDYKWFITIDLGCTEHKHYHWTRLPMGWQEVPSTFQRAMDLLMTGLRGVSMLVYIDDVNIFCRSYEVHVEHVESTSFRCWKEC